MNKMLTVCVAILFLIVVSPAPRFAAAAERQLQPQAKPSVKPLGTPPPAQPQATPQATPAVNPEPTITPLPLVRKAPQMVQKSVLANVDLRPDVACSVLTEPVVQNFGTYNPYSNMGKPLKVTAAVENAGLTKAEKVEVGVYYSRMPGQPLQQNSWEFHYTVDLDPGETVSFPFNIMFHSTMVQFTVKADFAGEEKNKGNNGSGIYMKFP